MKFFRICYYLLRQGLRNMAKNLFMIFASVAVVFSVLLVVGGLTALSRNIQAVIDQFSDRAEIQINFNYYVSDEAAEAYAETLKEDSRVKDAVFISKEENLEKIISYFEDERELFETYRDSERLRFATIEVYLNDYADGEAFVEEAEQLDGVDNVKDIVTTVDKMEVLGFAVKIGTVVAVVVMILLSVLLIFNTVKLTVFARHREIEIMKYVGATNTYIACPFIIEGVLTGLIGSILAFFAVKATYGAVYNALYDMALSANVELLSFSKAGGNVMWLIFALFGMLAGFVASGWAARRYMDV